MALFVAERVLAVCSPVFFDAPDAPQPYARLVSAVSTVVAVAAALLTALGAALLASAPAGVCVMLAVCVGGVLLSLAVELTLRTPLLRRRLNAMHRRGKRVAAAADGDVEVEMRRLDALAPEDFVGGGGDDAPMSQ